MRHRMLNCPLLKILPGFFCAALVTQKSHTNNCAAFKIFKLFYCPIPPAACVRLASSSNALFRWRAAFTWLLPKR